MKSKLIVISIIALLAAAGAVFYRFGFGKKITIAVSSALDDRRDIKISNHLAISPQKAVYATVWTAHSEKINDLIKLAGATEINSVVIDVKDNGVYIDDHIKNLVGALHQKNIYAIARIIVFQDKSQIKNHPDWYFKKKNGEIWKDARGWYWMNPENKTAWAYNLAIAKQAIDAGFDEINFDYIRFPAFSKKDDVAGGDAPAKNKIIDGFASYLTSELKKYDAGVKLSADLFAFNMLDSGDLGIGQKFTDLYGYFDYVCPMVYPSHYSVGDFGFANPADHPYEVIFGTIEKGKEQIRQKEIAAAGTTTPSLIDPSFKKDLKKLRPWLQDFNLGAMYDGNMIRKEKQALYDSGLTAGWLLWNPRNVYTAAALDK